MRKHPYLFLWIAVALLLIGAVLHIAVVISNNTRLDHCSGEWVALAMDLADGVFYRPLLSEDGYGGTQYMPLQFVLNAALIKLGIPPLYGGYIITVSSTFGILIGVFYLLRHLGVETKLLIPCTLLILSTASARMATTSIRGDILPAALNIWGLVFCAAVITRNWRPSAVFWAAIFFTLAFTAKITTLFGFAAALTALFLNGRKKAACKLAILTATGILLCLVTIHFVSQGRALDAFQVCASAGTRSVFGITGPKRMVAALVRNDPKALSLFILSAACLLINLKKSWKELSSLVFIITGLATAVIFSWIGASYNHLLDISVAAVILLAVQLQRKQLNLSFGVNVLAILAIIAFGRLMYKSYTHIQGLKNVNYESVLQRFNQSERPVLCENALLPVLAGQRPYLLNPFVFRIVIQKNPKIAKDFWRKLSEQYFGAVILISDPETKEGRECLNDHHIGPGFVKNLLKHYQPVERYHGSFCEMVTYRVVYLPKPANENKSGSVK